MYIFLYPESIYIYCKVKTTGGYYLQWFMLSFVMKLMYFQPNLISMLILSRLITKIIQFICFRCRSIKYTIYTQLSNNYFCEPNVKEILIMVKSRMMKGKPNDTMNWKCLYTPTSITEIIISSVRLLGSWLYKTIWMKVNG